MINAKSSASTSSQWRSGPNDRWIQVTWMPHTSLSQTSHVCLRVVSAHITIADPLLQREGQLDWKVRVTVHGVGGVQLVPLAVHTPASPLELRKPMLEQMTLHNFRPSVGQATHDCTWDYVAQVPIRWRELPRDSYLHIQVLQSGSNETVVSWCHV
jgi:hypothetical protein